MHAHQHACMRIWSFVTALLIGTCLHVHTYICMLAHIHMHAYVCIYTRVYAGLCDGLHDGDALTFGSRQPCAAVGSLGRCAGVLHRSSLLTSGELTYMRVCMYVCMHMYAAVGSFSRCIYCTLYTCTCLLLASAYVLLRVQLVSC